MFAIFFTEAMDPFYLIIGSFPTAVFTLFLFVCILYWFIAMLGMIDLDFLQIDAPDGDFSSDGGGDMGPVAGLLFKLKLTGVPFPIVFTLLTLFGWIISYYAVYFLSAVMSIALFKYLIGAVILLVSFYLSAVITSFVIRPLKRFFDVANQEVEKHVVGQVAVVRTARVDQQFGEATVEDGGAGLIVKVRSYKEEEFKRGDRVVLLEYMADENVFKVVSEEEFKLGL